MTLGEIGRRLESFRRTYNQRKKEEAFSNFQLATNTAISTARLLNGKPALQIEEVYPAFFKEEALVDEIDQASIARFKAFANEHNRNFSKEVNT